MSDKIDYFCPTPQKWNKIFNSLVEAWKEKNLSSDDKPPIPLILAAWHETTGLQKLLRWEETLLWAKRHECSHLIPELSNDETFRFMTIDDSNGSYPM